MNELHERVRDHGWSNLSDAEVLACVISSRPSYAKTVTKARDLLCRAGGMSAVADTKGTYQLAAAREYATRMLGESLLHGPALTRPDDSVNYLRARLRHLPYEVFGCLFLSNRHRVIGFEEMFRGTIDGASVHPREVVRAALECNAAAVIFAHNHPSGVAEPSGADRAITRTLRDALGLVGVRVLDHIVIGSDQPVSMAARGLI